MRITVTALVFLIFCAGFEYSGVGQPPNVVIFLADDQGWGDVGYNGNSNVRTPSIDRLAAEGAELLHFYVSPVCSPTRSEMLTGRYHPRSGVTATSAGLERIDLDETTIAEVFRAAGYATGAFGKWHNGMQPPYHPNARGFDTFYGFCSGHWGNYFSPLLEHNGTMVQGEGFVTDDFTHQALSFIEAHQDEPFLAYVAFNTPHSPMQVPDSFWERYADHPLGQRHREPEKEEIEHTRAALAMVENIDWNVGRIMEGLDRLGLDDNTIVLYFSDNGPNGARWNGDMKGRKGSTDEGGVRSPFVIRWPGMITSGTQISTVGAAIDLLPTLADFAGVAVSTNYPLDGQSLKQQILGQGETPADRYIFSYWRGRTSVRSQQYRLDDEGHLFDMETDPGQRTDVAAEHLDVVQEMQKARDAWAADVLAEIAEEDDRPFPIGHPDFSFTQLPARDAIATGQITRSNRYPNDSFFTNWLRPEDVITWDVDVLEDDLFEVEIYYTCASGDEGVVLELGMGESRLEAVIRESHDPSLVGMERDRVPRIESYVKDFIPMKMGMLSLKKGRGTLTLRALEIPGQQAIDFRMLMLRRIGP